MQILPVIESQSTRKADGVKRSYSFFYKPDSDDEVIQTVRKVRRTFGDRIKVQTPRLVNGKATVLASGKQTQVNRFVSKLARSISEFVVAEEKSDIDPDSYLEAANEALSTFIDKGKIDGEDKSWTDGINAILDKHLPEEHNAAMRMLMALKKDKIGSWGMASEVISKRMLELTNKNVVQITEDEPANPGQKTTVRITDQASFKTCGLKVGDRVMVNTQSADRPVYRLGTISGKHSKDRQFTISLDNGRQIRRGIDNSLSGILCKSRINKVIPKALSAVKALRCIDPKGWCANVVANGSIGVQYVVDSVISAKPSLRLANNDRVIVNLNTGSSRRPDLHIGTVRKRKGSGKSIQYYVVLDANRRMLGGDGHWVSIDFDGKGSGIVAVSSYVSKAHAWAIKPGDIDKFINKKKWFSPAVTQFQDRKKAEKPKLEAEKYFEKNPPRWVNLKRISDESAQFIAELHGDGLKPNKLHYPSGSNGDFEVKLGRFWFIHRGKDGLWSVAEQQGRSRRIIVSRIDDAEGIISEYRKLLKEIKVSIKAGDGEDDTRSKPFARPAGFGQEAWRQNWRENG